MKLNPYLRRFLISAVALGWTLFEKPLAWGCNACWDPISKWFIMHVAGDRYVSFKSQCQSALPWHSRFMATRWSYDDCPYSQSNSFSILSSSTSLFLFSTLSLPSFHLPVISPESMHYQSLKYADWILNLDRSRRLRFGPVFLNIANKQYTQPKLTRLS